MGRKFYILGWDGAAWHILSKFIKRGLMPNLESLIKEGASGTLNTSYPPLTPPAWASFMTGKNPGKHNVYDFYENNSKFNGIRVNNSDSIRSSIIWEYLSRVGFSHIISGIPLSYPYRRINGIYIGDFLTPATGALSEPPGIIEEVTQAIGPYLTLPREVFRPNNERRILEEAIRHVKYHLKVQAYLSEKYPWDIFVYYYNIVDRLQHELWHLLDPGHSWHDAKRAKLLQAMIDEFYALLDLSIAGARQGADSKTCLLVMSDHGFGAIEYTVSLNAALLKKSYLKVKGKASSRIRYLAYRLGLTPLAVYSLMSIFHLSRLRLSRYKGRIGRGLADRLGAAAFFGFKDIDWDNSYAFSRGNMGQIYLNKKGVTEQKRDEILGFLMGIKGEDGTGPVFSDILPREKVYSGDFTKNAPDLLPLPGDWRYNLNAPMDFMQNKAVKRIPRHGMPGGHRREGVYIMRQDGIKRGFKLNADITDLAPTMLYILDQYFTPNDFDGKVLQDIFEVKCD